MYAIAECAYEDAFIEITLSSFLLQAQSCSYPTQCSNIFIFPLWILDPRA